MNKTELVAAISEKTELTKKDSEKALKALIDVVAEELKNQAAFDIAALIAHIQRILPMGIERHFMTAAGTFHHTFSSP